MRYNEILNSINSVRVKIKDEHPNLYRSLSDTPEPIEGKEGKGTSKKVLQNYLSTISMLLNMHRRRRYINI